MRVKVNDHYSFEIETANDVLSVNGSEVQLDSRKFGNGNAHIIYQNKSYNVALVSEHLTEKTFVVKVNGNLYEVSIEDGYDILLKQMGMDSAEAAKVTEVRAPMPGLVLNVIVNEGQEVHKGDSLLVLEAMKMENAIKSPVNGIIKKVLILKGHKVEKNEILIQFQ